MEIEAETLEQFEKVMKAELAAQHDAEVLADDPELPVLEEELEELADTITTASDANEASRPSWVQIAAGGTVDALAVDLGVPVQVAVRAEFFDDIDSYARL